MLLPCFAAAEPLRIATWHVELSRDGPGRLLGDLMEPDDQVRAVVDVIASARPDVILLTDVDWDSGGEAALALQHLLDTAGTPLPHAFAPPPNAGVQRGLDVDGDGRTGEPEDALGYGRFRGDGGLLLLANRPLEPLRDLSALPWAEAPGSLMTEDERAALEPLPLGTIGHWSVTLDDGPELLLLMAGPPVFDGPEDRNGRRNADEVALWPHYLDGTLGPRADLPFVLLGNANLDPEDGDGRRDAIRALLSDPRLQDPQPRGDAPPDPAQAGDPGLDTADWPEPRPGNLRVSYVLPSADWIVTDAGVIWPTPGTPAATASRHGLVWVDLTRPGS
ncbi:endonuclease/exonuclease/phosphatase family protein [Mesobacterium pallidum]|uniref:endonuclease/exonuclease/phosphatase family protein n=1 Tax=Mesobacterium pallidum TaxID=2872037 RepID=UPI001EE27F8F|nr:endonuclease/exonuclease/phosphatase family protein [Mesobacterium pallidum]